MENLFWIGFVGAFLALGFAVIQAKKVLSFSEGTEQMQKIAAAIRSLLDDPERRAAMGERGYGALQTRFNWQTEEKKLLALYEELLPQ